MRNFKFHLPGVKAHLGGVCRGFTLVEMLVVIAILAVFGALILVIFTRTLRGGSKAQIVAAIKQNGQAVLEMIDKTVRDADRVYCPHVTSPGTTVSSKTLVVLKGGVFTRYRFVEPSPSLSPTSNGFIQQDNPLKQLRSTTPPYDYLKDSNGNFIDQTDTNFKNSVCSASDPMPEATILTDTNTQTGVSLQSGQFSIDKSPPYKDQVIIKFDLSPGIQASQVLGQIDPVSFQTTVQLR